MNENVLKIIRENWVLIIFIVSIIVGYTTQNARLTALESNDAKQDIRISVQETSLNSINTTLAEIQTTLNFIKDKINK